MDIQLSAPPLAVSYPEHSIGSLMESPAAVFPPDMTVKAATEAVREIVKRRFVTYAYIVDANRRLLGVAAMRDLLLARPEQPIAEVMLKDFFAFRPEMPLVDAMKLTLDKHYPSHPVTDHNGVLLGLLWGQRLFKAQSVELVAQADRWWVWTRRSVPTPTGRAVSSSAILGSSSTCSPPSSPPPSSSPPSIPPRFFLTSRVPTSDVTPAPSCPRPTH